MTAVGKSSSCFHMEECVFTLLILNKVFYLVISSCMNEPIILLRNIKLKKVLLNKLFLYFNLEKHRRILLCLRQRIRINIKIFILVLLFLILPYFLFSFLLPLCGSVFLEIIASPNKSRVICGREMRL